MQLHFRDSKLKKFPYKVSHLQRSTRAPKFQFQPPQPKRASYGPVNKALAKNVNDNIKLTYNALNGKVTVQLKNGYQLGLIGRMSTVLGFGIMIQKSSQKRLLVLT